jgi:hypothetical protein
MRVLTLTQPYASLVATRAKGLETRSWGTRYRGPLAIHAAKSVSPLGGRSAFLELCEREPFRSAIAAAEYTSPDELPFGAIVAVCTLGECYEIRPKGLWAHETLISLPDEPERSFGNYSPGRYAFRLDDVHTLPRPLPYKGGQGLRSISDAAVLRAIFEQVQG